MQNIDYSLSSLGAEMKRMSHSLKQVVEYVTAMNSGVGGGPQLSTMA